MPIDHPLFELAPEGISEGAATAALEQFSKENLNALLEGAGKVPGATTVVAVLGTPAEGAEAPIRLVQTLDAYIAVLSAVFMDNGHPEGYQLSDPRQAALFVTNLAGARNFILTGGTVKAIPVYLMPRGLPAMQSFHKTTTPGDVHKDILQALFEFLLLPPSVLKQLDAVLGEVGDALKEAPISYGDPKQTVNHFVSLYYLAPAPGVDPPLHVMNAEFIHVQLDPGSWKASASKPAVPRFSLELRMTRTSALVNMGNVAAYASAIYGALTQYTGNDIRTICEMTNLRVLQP